MSVLNATIFQNDVLAGNTNVILRWEGYCNNGNNIYLDNIRIEGNATNAPPQAAFDANWDLPACVGKLVQFQNESTGYPTSYLWTFTGGNPATSFVQNPTNICYNIAGNYNASVTVTSACGNTTTNVPNYITVSATPNPVIAGAPSGTVCNGTNVVLSTTTLFLNYQWNLNGVAIAGETSPTLSVSSSGNYTVTCSNNPSCELTSSAETVNFSTITSPTISTFNPLNLLKSSSKLILFVIILQIYQF
jgi:PKD repeat protein